MHRMSNKVHVRDNSIVHKNSVYSTQLNIYNFYMVASFEGYLLSIGHCLEGFYFPPFSTFTSSSLPFTTLPSQSPPSSNPSPLFSTHPFPSCPLQVHPFSYPSLSKPTLYNPPLCKFSPFKHTLYHPSLS